LPLHWLSRTLIREIGRMREVTFRAVGEGTNRATDLDEYDFYYHHLVIGMRQPCTRRGYRVGKGREINTASMVSRGFKSTPCSGYASHLNLSWLNLLSWDAHSSWAVVP
jgi:hypothetical protein